MVGVRVGTGMGGGGVGWGFIKLGCKGGVGRARWVRGLFKEGYGV